jgi:hypothetical protein
MSEPYTCSCCGAEESKTVVDRRFSFGVYAGRLCDQCAYKKYIDHCGLAMDKNGRIYEGGEQGNPGMLDEPLEPD